MKQECAMRVAYILKMYPRFSETFIVNEILAHEAAGLDVEIVSLRSPIDGRFHEDHARVRAPVTYISAENAKANGFWEAIHGASHIYPEVWNVLRDNPGVAVRDLHQALQVASLVHKRGYTHLHAHFGSVATTVARLVSLMTGIPYLFTAHAKDIFHESVDPDDLEAKLSAAEAVITVSEFNLDYLRRNYVATAPLRRVYNGLNLAHFPYASPLDRPRRIVAVGRLVEKKGFGDLLKACAILSRRRANFQCELIGAGPMEEKLRAMVVSLGIEEYVSLLGPRPQGEVVKHVQAGAVFAAPCKIAGDGNRDGLPTVLLEAMALGTPVVATDVTGIPEVLSHGKTGLMISQSDPSGLADMLEQLLDRPQLRVRLAQEARHRIEENFDVRHNSALIRSIYGSMAAVPARSLVVEMA
jgi:glycosyltransferase involved in cell wall biosynthesis